MQSCLGIYIQNKIIKYAKISKEHNNLKVEAYGIKFYDTDLEKIIEQIVKETYSYQVPISVNLDKENYAYSNIFALLQPKDQEKAIATEFEVYCNTNNKNKNTINVRRLKAPNLEDRDKTRIIYTYVDKTNLIERLQLLDKYKVNNVSPLTTTITDLNRAAMQENCVIVNLEDKTTLTTIIDGKIQKIDVLEESMSKILTSIQERENSISKAYEICKNTTVYTKSSQNLKIEGNEYLDEIITALFEIIDKIKQTITTNGMEIDSIYLTGTGIIINNIDLLFQENFIDKKCELLIPSFVEKTNVKISIKDYIEVNSAIALALHGLDGKKHEDNFNVKGSFFDDVKKMFSTAGKIERKKRRIQFSFKDSFKNLTTKDLDMFDKMLLRAGATAILVIIFYIGIANVLTEEITKKTEEASECTKNINKEIGIVNNYNSLINSRTSEYQRLISKIEEQNEKISEDYSSKNAIPNMLNKIMYVIPTGVQVLSIENSSGKSVTIIAQADKYDQLGYFKAALEEEGILTNVTTTKGVKSGEMINITITGELPY